MRGHLVRLVVIAAIVATGVLLLLSHPGSNEVEEGERSSARLDNAEARPMEAAEDAVLRGAPSTEPATARHPTETARRPDGVHIRYLGRVVDERRRGVANAVVTLRARGEVLFETQTDESGGYVLGGRVRLGPGARVSWSDGSRSEEITLFARSPDDHTGSRVLGISDRPTDRWEITLDPLVLRTAYQIGVRVEHEGMPISGAVVRTGPEGTTTVTGLSRGSD